MPYRFGVEPKTLWVEGGRILPAAGDPCSPKGLRRIVVLVHGFNNDTGQARSRYAVFRQRLGEIVRDHLTLIWELYWPGYDEHVAEPLRQRWSGLRAANSLMTAVRYYKQVPKAIESGRVLGDYIASLKSESAATEVILIGHSLGCRVILEAMKALVGGARRQVPAVCLMAPAVPVSFAEGAGTLKDAVAFPMRSVVLHSRRDTVLRYTFPAGQSLANEGRFPEAVGLRGNPRTSWTMRDETMLRHGEYWSDRVTNPHIARVFGRVTRHDLTSFAPIPWELPGSDALPAWELPERALSVRQS